MAKKNKSFSVNVYENFSDGTREIAIHDKKHKTTVIIPLECKKELLKDIKKLIKKTK